MGKLEMYVGCMFSGKTEKLRDRIHRERFRFSHTEQHPTVQLFKPAIDNRFGTGTEIVSHNGTTTPCVLVSYAADIAQYVALHSTLRVVGIDEVQFLDDTIIDWCVYTFRHTPLHIIASGLNTDFRGELFRFRNSERNMGELIGHAQAEPLTAFCAYRLPNTNLLCGNDATCTQRLKIDGTPVPYLDPLVHVGGKDPSGERRYEARCVEHHFVPGRNDRSVTFK